MRANFPSRLSVVATIVTAVAACVPMPAGRDAPTSEAPLATIESRDGGDAPGKTPASSGPGASPSFVRPTPRPSPTFLVYEVRAGDTLTSIARQFGTTARSIAYWNRAAYPSLDPDAPTYAPGLIKVGWILLLIPTAVVDEDEFEEPASPPSPSGSPI